MDLRYYFDAVNFSEFDDNIISKNKNSIGRLIQKNIQRFSDESLKNIDLAIIGVPFEDNTPNKGTGKAPNEIRKHLYALNAVDPKLKIIDLGNIKSVKSEKAIYYALRDIIDYLTEYGLTTIVLGGGQDLSVGIAKAFKNKKYLQLTTIDPIIDLSIGKQSFSSLNYVSRILTEIPDLFSINFIGYQSYFVSGKIISKIEELLFNPVRLGDIRQNISAIEPILRDTDFLSFDISAVRQSDSPGYYNCSPNGFYSEETCIIARYAGLSDRLKVFGLFEVNPEYDNHSQTSKLAAQAIWYFIEGFLGRTNDFPQKSLSAYTQYNVEIEELDKPIKFFNNKKTGRWWFELNTNENQPIAISCTEEDYLSASKKEIPEKWLKFIRKIDKMSK